MKSVLKAIASKVVTPVANMTLTTGDKINARAVEFVIHYLVGNKQTMTLNPQEIEATKSQWMREAMHNQLGGLDFAEGIVNASHSDDCQDQWEDEYTEDDGDLHVTSVYLTGKTHGIVGGWNFTLDHNNCVVKCYDVWDFNPTTLDLQVKVPNNVRKMVQAMLDKFNIPYQAHEMFGESTQFEFNENKLNQLNEKHAFRTEWEFSIEGMSCPVYYEQARYDWMTTTQQSRNLRPSDGHCAYLLENAVNWF